MQDPSDEDRAYLTSMMDHPSDLMLGAFDSTTGTEGLLKYEIDAALRLIERQFSVINTFEDDDAVEIYLAPIDALHLLVLDKGRRTIIADGITPRQFYQLLNVLTQQFPQALRLYVTCDDASFAWLRTDLAEEDAILHMLTHDETVPDALGLQEDDDNSF